MAQKRSFTTDDVMTEIMMDSESEYEPSDDSDCDSDGDVSVNSSGNNDLDNVCVPSTSSSQPVCSDTNNVRQSRGPTRARGRPRGGRGRGGRQPAPATNSERWIEPDVHGNIENVPDFSADTGIRVDLPDSGSAASTPEFYFNVFMEPMFELFVRETNRYAEQVRAARPDYYYNSHFHGTDLREMRRFVGLMILMGIVDKPTVRLYWSENPLIETPYFKKVMSRDTYLALQAFFHLADNDNMTHRNDPDHDKLFKARPLFDHLNQRFPEVYYPEQNLAVDESMMPWKGRVGFRQFIPSKPIRYGMKIYCICESSSGYICKMKFYTGARGNQREVGHGQNVVKEVSDGYLGKGHTIFMDSFFSTVSLFQYLRDNDTTACGTVLKFRKENPPDISSKAFKIKKGEHVVRQQDNLIAMRYHDRKDIMLLSTAHNAEPVRTGNVDRQTGNPIKRPRMVQEYNKNMKGVDQLDQFLSYYSFNRKTLKWWKRAATHLIHVAKVQSHILYQKHNKQHSPLTQLDFTLILVKQLTDTPESDIIPRPLPPVECQRLSHRTNPHHFEPIPATAKCQNPMKNCFACTLYSGKRKSYIRRKTTRYQCKMCKLPLCVYPCFEFYHTYSDYSREVRRHFNAVDPDDAGDN